MTIIKNICNRDDGACMVIYPNQEVADKEERKGTASKGINISQVFDEELAKITDKNITDICKKQQPKGLNSQKT